MLRIRLFLYKFFRLFTEQNRKKLKNILSSIIFKDIPCT